MSSYAADDNIIYCARTNNEPISFVGTTKKDSYDVATMLDSKQLKGKKITYIQVPIRRGSTTDNVKLWLSKQLNLTLTKKNVPDIISLDAIINDTIASVTLPEPYTIDSDTIYIGYSFDVTSTSDADRAPVAVVKNNASDGLWMHTANTYKKWLNKSKYGCSVIEVGISGVDGDVASLSIPNTIYASTNAPINVTASLINHGYNGVKSIDYSYTIGEHKGNGHIDLDTPIKAYINASANVTLQLDAITAKGNYPLMVSLDKVNGVSTTDATASSANLKLYSFLPKHTAVMEEYTGTWCGWCPRGWVALEVMNRLHPDFIALSYHYGDIMQVFRSVKDNQYPVSQASMGYPGSFIDRGSKSLDPFYGSGSDYFGIEQAWKDSCNNLAPADITTEASFTDGGKKIAAKAHLIFPEDEANGSKYKVEFVLLADSLHGTGSSWAQHSYYTPKDSTEITFPEADILFKGNEYLYLNFNDVVVASTRANEGYIDLPTQIIADKTIDIEGEFDVDKIQSISENQTGAYTYLGPIIQDSKNLRIVALLINENGRIANGAKAKVTGAETTGIEFASDKQQYNDKPSAVFDLQGRRLSALHKGLNIVTYPSGKTRKVVVK